MDVHPVCAVTNNEGECLFVQADAGYGNTALVARVEHKACHEQAKTEKFKTSFHKTFFFHIS